MASKLLRDLSSSSDNVTFINVARMFSHDRIVKSELFDQGGIHLNQDGVKLLARLNFTTLRNLPYATFSHK